MQERIPVLAVWQPPYGFGDPEDGTYCHINLNYTY
jgi:hypothetical protein